MWIRSASKSIIMFHALKLLLQVLGNHNITHQHFEEMYDNVCDTFSCQQLTCTVSTVTETLLLQSNRICGLRSFSCHPNLKQSIPGSILIHSKSFYLKYFLSLSSKFFIQYFNSTYICTALLRLWRTSVYHSSQTNFS